MAHGSLPAGVHCIAEKYIVRENARQRDESDETSPSANRQIDFDLRCDALDSPSGKWEQIVGSEVQSPGWKFHRES
jgi:hypothetical protein